MSNARELSQLASLVTVDANNKITFASTSEVEFGGLALPATDGSNGQVLTTDGAGNLTFTSAAGGGLADIVEDTTPQLGGNLDVNDKLIYNDTGTVKLQAGSADYVTIVNSAGADRIRFSDIGGIAALGWYHQFGDSSATRGFVNIMGTDQGFDPGSGALKIFDGDSSAGVTLTVPTTLSGNVLLTLPGADGSNGQVLTTDGSGNLSFTTPSGGISNLVEDTTPQLGGNLDTVGNSITSSNAYLFLTGSTQTGGQTTQTGQVWISGADNSSNQSGTVYINGVSGGSLDPADVGNVYINYQGNNGQPYGTTYIGTTNGLNGGFFDNEVQIRGLWWPDADGSNGQVLTTDGSGNLSFTTISGGISNIVEDTTPQLGGDLDTNGKKIRPATQFQALNIETYNGDITIDPSYGSTIIKGGINTFAQANITIYNGITIDSNPTAPGGSNGTVIDGLTYPSTDGTNGQVLTTNGSGNLSFADASGGISNVVEDTTPQLGGDLDLNGNAIRDANIYFGDDLGNPPHSYFDSNGRLEIGGDFVVNSGEIVLNNGASDTAITLDGANGANNLVIATSADDAEMLVHNALTIKNPARTNTYLNINTFSQEATLGNTSTYTRLSGQNVAVYSTANTDIGNSLATDNVNIGSISGPDTPINMFGPVKFTNLTTTERDALTVAGGEVVFNETTSNLQVYDGTSWLNASGGISNIVEDTTPQLGGNLDLNNNYIGDSTAYLKAYDFGTGSQFAVYMQGELSAALEIYSNAGSSVANVTIKSDLTVSGGDITLGGTGRIQGIDTVSANTDAANKLYVDNAVAGAGGGGGFASSYVAAVLFG